MQLVPVIIICAQKALRLALLIQERGGYSPDSRSARMPSSEHIKTGGNFPGSVPRPPPCSAGSNVTSQISPSAIVGDPKSELFLFLLVPAREKSSCCRRRSHASTLPLEPPTFTVSNNSTKLSKKSEPPHRQEREAKAG